MLHNRCGPWHAVLFTGDLVYSGQPNQFENLEKKVLGPLWDKLEALGSEGVILLAVPGNHDLERPKRSAAANWLIEPGGFEKIANDFWSDSDNEYRKVVTTAFDPYSRWWSQTRFRKPNRYPLQIHDGLLPGDFAATVEIGKLQVGVVGLNTTFLQLAGGNFNGRLAWDVCQLHEICTEDANEWVGRHDACLLMTHQPDQWFTTAAKQAYPLVNPAGRFAAHLFGHMHETNLTEMGYGGGPLLRRWQSRSLFGMDKFGEPPSTIREHGYLAGRIQFNGDTITIHCWPRRAICDPNGWRLVQDELSGPLDEGGGTMSAPVLVKKKACASSYAGAKKGRTK